MTQPHLTAKSRVTVHARPLAQGNHLGQIPGAAIRLRASTSSPLGCADHREEDMAKTGDTRCSQLSGSGKVRRSRRRYPS